MTCVAPACSADDATTRSLLDEWKRLTVAGLQASQAHCAAHALTWHVQALRVANQLLQPCHGGADDDRLAALIVAHLNIADCYTDLGQPEEAMQCVSCAHHKLLGLVHGEATPVPLRQAAYRHLHQTFAALIEHGGAWAGTAPPSYPPPPPASRSLLH
ncbi:hypothetical protein HNP33_002416 [Comamonas odontotermitis]|uniref:Uncharacterized protein n=1 Tax=Comamonas odontotermitis TaxID=379895 RepID=A0ABR6RGP3_9BURK|nr:hypothetical protein [Comamonas odontotermitis]MBB6578335.1 hypothetical protein [Comamonas odontotermitis]